MKLQELLPGFAVAAENAEISGLALDSRNVKPGDAFLALAGARGHGLQHLPQALAQGASALLFDPAGFDQAEPLTEELEIPSVAIDRLRLKLGDLAGRFYGNPSHYLAVIGITGTNGKTSCSQFLAQMLPDCGIIGTLGWGRFQALRPTANTTPDAVSVQTMLAELKRLGMAHVAMEVSSHGLDQGRIDGLRFKGAVFTNISRDHLDYHGSMEAYLEAKLRLLGQPGLEFAVVNLDSAYSERIIEAIPESVQAWGFSLSGKKSFRGQTVAGSNLRHGRAGLAFDVDWRGLKASVTLPLYGDFNGENGLAVLTVLLALGQSLAAAAERLGRLKAVPGRMQRFGEAGEPAVFVDYAHTPDALEKALSTLKKHAPKQLTAVFGCGGDRDRGKRPLMGACAERWADRVIITDDNPRTEESAAIIEDILAGCRSGKVAVIADRRKAIAQALRQAGPEDWILVAGKGHEDYQEIRGVRHPFRDADAVVDALRRRREP